MKLPDPKKLFVCLWLCTALAACGGGSSSAPAVSNTPSSAKNAVGSTYTVGGTVLGLSGTGLVLSNNNVDLPVSGNGSFTLAADFTNGSTYAITVGANPSAPTQVCTLSNASGTVNNANVTNVTVSCVNATVTSTTQDGQWQTPGLIETKPGNASDSQVAVDAAGNALAVWVQSDGTCIHIWANRYVAGSGWGSATQIETSKTGDSYAPQIAVDAAGNAVAVWAKSDGSHTHIWANRYVAGAGWGSATRIETSNFDAGFARIALDTAGNGLAVWVQNDGTRDNIWANRYVAGAGWGSATRIDTHTVGGTSDPQVAFDATGNALAIWNQLDMDPSDVNGSSIHIWSKRYVVGSGWGSTIRVASTSGSARALTVDTAGNAFALWGRGFADDEVSQVWVSRYVAGSGWESATLIDEQGVFPQDIAVDAAGNALVVWNKFDGTNSHIAAKRYVVGSGWGATNPIDADSGDVSDPKARIAVDPAGNALVVWQHWDGTFNPDDTITTRIWSNRYVVGSGWGSATLIEAAHITGASSNEGNASDPHVAIDAAGNALAVWQEWDGTRENILANRFE